MRILVVHNRYQLPGGEDSVVEQEIAMLRHAGHEVITYSRSNDEVQLLALRGQLLLPLRAVWARDTVRDVQSLVRQSSPDVVHVHNTHFMISPSVYHACKSLGVPVVQTVHNYRLVCPNALLLRDGHVCEDCLGKTPPWPGVVHACYRSSRLQTAMVATVLTFHRLRRTWQEQVDLYIALTDFGRQKLIEGGLPARKIAVKPNFVYPDPGAGEGDGHYALFVGRLSPEKGIAVLLQAWQLLQGRLPLKAVGDGPLAHEVRAASGRLRGVEVVGHLPLPEVNALMGRAACVIMPSVCYEGCPRVVIEALACGTPVVASAIGALAELVGDEQVGLRFRPGDANDLAAKVEWLLDHPQEVVRMRREARAEYLAKYTAERNHELLMALYAQAVQGSHA